MPRLIAVLLAALILGGVGLIVFRLPLALTRRIWFWAFTAVLLSSVSMLSAHSYVARWAFRGDEPRHSLTALMDGTADRPFVYRRLAPEIVRVATALVFKWVPPEKLDYLVKESALRRYRGSWVADETWDRKKATAFHLAYILVWGALFAATLIGAELLRQACGLSPFEAVVTSALLMCLLPLTFVNGGYLYDATELFLWLLLLSVVFRGWVVAVPVVFALMISNKETAVMVIPAIFPLLLSRKGLTAATTVTAFLGIVGVGWLWFIRNKYAANAGGSVEFWLLRNMEYWTSPGTYLGFTQLYSPTLVSPRGANVLNLLLLLLPLRFGWPTAGWDVRWALGLMAIVSVPVFLAFGGLDEVRNLSLLFPLLVIVGVKGIHAEFSRQQ